MMMKRLASILFALAVAVNQASAGFVINSFWTAPVGGAASITFIACSGNASNLTTYTFTAANVGTENADRKTIVGIAAEDSAAGYGVNSVTIGGDGATEVVDSAGVTAVINASIYVMANPSGTSEDIVVTFSEAVTSAAICVWSATMNSTTAVATASDDDVNSGVLALSVNTQDDGIVVGMGGVGTSGLANTWVGVTERADSAVAAELGYTAGDATISTGSTPLTVTSDYTSTFDAASASASFR